MSSKPYHVTIYERDQPGRRLEARLADTAPTPSAGGGGHQPVTLPKRAAVTIWQGRDQPMQMSLPIFLGDGLISGRPVFVEQTRLLEMWRPADPTDEPPVIKLRSPGSAVPFQNLAWVLTDVAWDDTGGGVAGDEHGNRVLQKLTLQLTEYRADERLQVTRLKTKKAHKHKGVHKVKSGETLRHLAARYRVAGGWRAIADVQSPPLRDPNQITAGMALQIPADS